MSHQLIVKEATMFENFYSVKTNDIHGFHQHIQSWMVRQRYVSLMFPLKNVLFFTTTLRKKERFWQVLYRRRQMTADVHKIVMVSNSNNIAKCKVSDNYLKKPILWRKIYVSNNSRGIPSQTVARKRASETQFSYWATVNIILKRHPIFAVPFISERSENGADFFFVQQHWKNQKQFFSFHFTSIFCSKCIFSQIVLLFAEISKQNSNHLPTKS